MFLNEGVVADLEAQEVIAKALNDDDVEYVWDTAETILSALEQAGFSTSREQGRYEQVGTLTREKGQPVFTWSEYIEADAYPVPVFRRVDGDFE